MLVSHGDSSNYVLYRGCATQVRIGCDLIRRVVCPASAVVIRTGPNAGVLRLWDFVQDFRQHGHHFLPGGIVCAHLGGEIVAQFAHLVALQTRVVVNRVPAPKARNVKAWAIGPGGIR